MLVPVLIVRDFPESIDFLTRILDFELVFASPTDKPFYGVLTRGGDELHLNLVPQAAASVTLRSLSFVMP